MKKNTPTFEECSNIIEYLYPSMHDYIYILDIKRDFYQISPKAVEKFKIPSVRFNDVINIHKQFVCADDYDALVEDLAKVVSGEEDSHDLLYRWIGRDDKLYWIHCVGHLVRDEKGAPSLLLGCVNEAGNANYADNKTGLLGEELFKQFLNDNIAKINSGYIIKLCIDEIKAINERYGFDYGNNILRRTANIILNVLNENQHCFTLSNEEYVIVDFDSKSIEEASSIFKKIRLKVSEDIVNRNYEGLYTLSAGLVDLGPINSDIDIILKKIEFSLDVAIKHGRNQLYVYNDDDYNKFLKKSQIIKALNKAVASNFDGFIIHYQPIVDAKTNTISGAEALLRFRFNDGIISPAEFIPLLEETGLIVPVGKYVINQAATFCKEMRNVIPSFRVSVNISYVQIIKGVHFREHFKVIENMGLPYEAFIVELTESGYLEDSNMVHEAWNHLKNDGIHLAIDDFGSGYSNIHNITMLNPNRIKIDMTFTKNAMKTDYDFELLRNIILLAHELGIQVVVEGIETNDENERIRQINPDYIQGYYYSRPVTLEKFKEYVNNSLK